jgi:hypothetical protein
MSSHQIVRTYRNALAATIHSNVDPTCANALDGAVAVTHHPSVGGRAALNPLALQPIGRSFFQDMLVAIFDVSTIVGG